MMICIGGVCIPLNLLLPFLVGLAHRYGLFTFLKPEWFTLRYWQNRWAGKEGKESGGSAKAGTGVQEAGQKAEAVDAKLRHRQESAPLGDTGQPAAAS